MYAQVMALLLIPQHPAGNHWHRFRCQKDGIEESEIWDGKGPAEKNQQLRTVRGGLPLFSLSLYEN